LYWESPRTPGNYYICFYFCSNLLFTICLGADADVLRRALDPDAMSQGRPQSWVAEKHEYDMRSHRCSGVCGHWTQIVWGITEEIGCAIACRPRSNLVAMSSPRVRLGAPYIPGAPQAVTPFSFPGMVALVCRYSPPGNMMGENFNTRRANPSRPQVQPQPRPQVQPQPRPIQPQPLPTQPRPTGSGRGECPGGRAPRQFYDSGCSMPHARSVRCVSPPPAPMSSMSQQQVTEMQEIAMNVMSTGRTDTCCAASGRLYCRGPRGGFPPGTRGV
jgi:hypothetical protein